MSWNLILLKLSARKIQILLSESFIDICVLTLLTLIAINPELNKPFTPDNFRKYSKKQTTNIDILQF